MRKFTVLLASVFAFGAIAMAQMEPKPLEVPKTEAYFGYDYQYADTTGSSIVNSTNLNGFALEFSHYMHSNNFGLTLDISHASNSRVDSTGIKYSRSDYMAGPTYRFRSVGFFTANVHALAGFDRGNFTVPETSTELSYQNTDFAAAAGVTVDGNLSRHLGIRLAQVDYLYTHHNNAGQNSFRYTGGVVVRF